MRVGVVNRDKFFSGCSQLSQGFDQFRRIHLELGGAFSNVGYWDESAGRNQPATLFRVCGLRVLKHLLEYFRFERKIHENVLYDETRDG